MKQFPTEQIERLIREEKWTEVGATIKEWIEKGTAGNDMLDAVRAYVKLKTKLTEEYNKKLDGLILEAEKAVEAGKKIDDADKVAGVKKKLKDF